MKGVLLAGAILIFLAGFEVFARHRLTPIRINMLGEYRERVFTHDPLLGHRMIPHRTATMRDGDSRVEVAANSLGFRGPDYSGPKPAGIRRIILLGDSYAFGLGLPYRDCMAARLDTLLDSCEVLNFGLPGYGTLEQLLILREIAAPLDPDLVVILYCQNDIPGNVAKRSRMNNKPYLEIDEGGSLQILGVPVPDHEPETPSRGIQKLPENSAAYRLLRYRLGLLAPSLRANTRSKEALAEFWDQTPLAETYQEAPRATLEAIRSIARESVAPVILTSTILARQLRREAKIDPLRDDLPRIACKEDNLHWLDLLPSFRTAAESGPLWLETNGHWNATANELAAREIIRMIGTHELLGPVDGAGPPGSNN